MVQRVKSFRLLFTACAAALLIGPGQVKGQDGASDGRVAQPVIALTNANVVDVVTGQILEGQTVLLRDG